MPHSVELQMLWCALALGILQLVVATAMSVAGRGLPWGIGPRDEAAAPLGTTAARLDRAYKNFMETFVFFAAAVLLNYALGKSTGTSALGAQIYLWARVLYVPAYAVAIPYTRTLTWGVSLVGILMVMSAVWPG